MIADDQCIFAFSLGTLGILVFCIFKQFNTFSQVPGTSTTPCHTIFSHDITGYHMLTHMTCSPKMHPTPHISMPFVGEPGTCKL